MQEKDESEAEHYDSAGPRPDRLLNGGARFGSGCRRTQQDDQADSAEAQNDAGVTVADRQNRGELRPVDLDVGRERLSG